MTNTNFRRGPRKFRIIKARDLFKALQALGVGESLTLPTGIKVTSISADNGGGVMTSRGEKLCSWHVATGIYGVNTTFVEDV